MLIAEPTLPRNAWLMGHMKTFPDSNGLVVTARIQTKHSVITRPITRLCVIVSKDQNRRIMHLYLFVHKRHANRLSN